MKWKKLGVVWCPSGDLWWAKEYATCPTPFMLPDGGLRIYIQGRDASGVGRVGFVDVDKNDPLKILHVSPEPVLDIGKPGTFDDNGVFQTSIINSHDGRVFMYYVGFELCHHIRYRLLTGLAVSEDNGKTFQKFKTTPILERTENELYFRCGPFVSFTPTDKYRMWYIGGNEWEVLNGKSLPIYTLRYIESQDGVNWPDISEGILELNRDSEHGFGRPWVMLTKNTYQLFYSIRKKFPMAYRLGYAESSDGIAWQRKDEEMNLDVATEGWDSESIEYSAVIRVGNRSFCFYNGNDFGKTGFGVAELLE